MIDFRFIRENVTVRDYAERSGFRVSRSGMICCPFHNDTHPSMKVGRRYFCFACGEKGDVLDFVSKLENVSLPEAARRICGVFSLDPQETGSAEKRERVITPAERKIELIDRLIAREKALNRRINALTAKDGRARGDIGELLLIRRRSEFTGYLLDTLFACTTDAEINAFLDYYYKLTGKEKEKRNEH